jgi:hypothetical protein
MQAWGKWFQSIGEKMVDMGGPFGAGKEISHSGTKELPMGPESLTGYCVINAESFADAEAIAMDCPIITSVRIYEAMPMH